jgi:hypothetical protein
MSIRVALAGDAMLGRGVGAQIAVAGPHCLFPPRYGSISVPRGRKPAGQAGRYPLGACALEPAGKASAAPLQVSWISTG